LGLQFSSTVYALDSTTIDPCLSVLPWAHFRTTKAAVEMHTLLDLRSNIPNFIHISDGKMHDVHALDLIVLEPGASKSWIAATSILLVCIPCIWPADCSSSVRSPT